MEDKKQQKLIQMEKKYLAAALEKCILCFDKSLNDDCSAKCGQQYFSFMKLK